MSFRYTFPVIADMGSLSSGIKNLCDSLNKTMSEFGVAEKVSLQAPIAEASFSHERNLEAWEIGIITDSIIAGIKKSSPELVVRAGPVTRVEVA